MEKMENNEFKVKGRVDIKKYENEKRKREFYFKWKEDYKRVMRIWCFLFRVGFLIYIVRVRESKS